MLRYLLLLCFFPVLLFGQRSGDWLKKHDQGNRYEGSYKQNISHVGSLELISFHGQWPKYKHGEGQKLFISWICPKATKYKLKAEEHRVRDFFWMESKSHEADSGWNKFGPWPVDEGLKKHRITASNLGILITDSTDQKRIYPAFVHQKSTPDTAKTYLARFRLGASISKGNYSVKGPKGKTVIASKAIPAQSGGSQILAPIGTATMKEKGWYQLKLELISKPDSTGTKAAMVYNYHFYHKP